MRMVLFIIGILNCHGDLCLDVALRMVHCGRLQGYMLCGVEPLLLYVESVSVIVVTLENS